MKVDFTRELGGIYFQGTLVVENEDDVYLEDVFVKRISSGMQRNEAIELNDWTYKGTDLQEALIEALDDQINELIEATGDEDEDE